MAIIIPGYGITDALTEQALIPELNSRDAANRDRANHTGTQSWGTLTGTPTTLSGYGITDGLTTSAAAAAYQPLDGDLTAIGGLIGTAGLLRKTAANTWTLDTTAYGTGTVTSVGLAVPTGFSASGSPVTGSGDLTLNFAAGYALPTTAKQANWDTAYGWGNHAAAGYLTTTGGQTIDGNLTATRFTSNQTTGIAPFTVNSTTVVPNLNADLLDGYNIGTGGTSYIPYVDSSGRFTAKNLVTVFNTSTDSGWYLGLDPVFWGMYIQIPKPDDATSRIRINGGSNVSATSSLMLAAAGGNSFASTSSIGNNSYNSKTDTIDISRVRSYITGFTFVFRNLNDTYKFQDFVRLIRTDTDGTQSTYWNVNATGDVESLGYTKATRFISTQATGTAPLTVSSTTVVSNLNADLLDGKEASAFSERVAVPATASSTGTTGQIAFDSSYFYACVATNTWVRAPLATW